MVLTLVRDPVTRSLLGGRPRRWPFVVAGLFTLAVAAAAIVVALGVIQRYGDSRSGAPTAPIESAPTVPDLPAAPTKALVLPQPASYDGVVPLGYPRSTAGAVAAAYGYSRIATGLDVAPTLQAVEKIADPTAGWYARHRDSLADGLVEQRRGLGLPPVGPVSSANLSVTPAGYQLLDRATELSVSVLTLNIVSATATDGTRTSGTVVLRWDLRWDGSRWLATRLYSVGEHDALAVTPLTSQATGLGWQVASGG